MNLKPTVTKYRHFKTVTYQAALEGVWPLASQGNTRDEAIAGLEAKITKALHAEYTPLFLAYRGKLGMVYCDLGQYAYRIADADDPNRSGCTAGADWPNRDACYRDMARHLAEMTWSPDDDDVQHLDTIGIHGDDRAFMLRSFRWQRAAMQALKEGKTQDEAREYANTQA